MSQNEADVAQPQDFFELEDHSDTISSNINDLPNELLSHILLLLNKSDLNNANLVCRRWYVIIDEMIGRKLNLGRQCQLIPLNGDRYNQKYVDITAINKIGINECFLGEVVEINRTRSFWSFIFATLKSILPIYNGEFIPEFKHPHLVKRIHFDGPIPGKYFPPIMKKVENLTMLEMHLTAFCSLSTPSLYKVGSKLKRLTTLKIWGHRLQEGLFTNYYQSGGIIPNILVFLTNRFPSLTSFIMEYPSDFRDDKVFTERILGLLKKHRSTLRKFRLSVNISLTEEEQQQEGGFLEQESSKEAKSVSKVLQLKEIELIVNSMRMRRLTKLWIAFVEQQRNLEAATVLSFRIPSTIVATLCANNGQTLKRLFVSRSNMVENDHEIQLNCAIFSCCTCLRTLVVEGMPRTSTTPGLIATTSLPHTLTHLEIAGLSLLHEDAHHLLCGLPRLQHVSLTDAGKLGSLGVTLNTVKRVITEDRRIRIVTLYRSFCGMFPSTGVHNGNPNNPQFIKQRPYEIIEFVLNEAGYYENLHQEFFEDFVEAEFQ